MVTYFIGYVSRACEHTIWIQKYFGNLQLSTAASSKVSKISILTVLFVSLWKMISCMGFLYRNTTNTISLSPNGVFTDRHTYRTAYFPNVLLTQRRHQLTAYLPNGINTNDIPTYLTEYLLSNIFTNGIYLPDGIIIQRRNITAYSPHGILTERHNYPI